MKMKLFFIAALAVAAFNTAKAQEDPDTTTRTFIIKASIGNLNEIESGQMAAAKATRPDVKAFGSQMVTDHGKAQAKLMQLAKAGGYQIPPQATGGIMPVTMLKNATGKDFDRLYVHMMVPGHAQTVEMFQTYAIKGKDPVIRAFAQQMLPILKEHLAAITAIDKEITDMAK